MGEDRDKTRLIIKVLLVVVVILALVVLYMAVFQQEYNNFVAQKQVEGANLFISQVLIPQLQTQGYVAIPIGNGTLYLVPVQPQPQTETPDINGTQ